MKKVNEQKREQEQQIRAEIERNRTNLQQSRLNLDLPKPPGVVVKDNSAELAAKMAQDQKRLENNMASQNLEKNFEQAKYGTRHSFNRNSHP